MASHESTRRMRILQLMNSIKKCSEKDVGCNKEKLINCMMIEHSCSRRTCLEYISGLIGARKIKEEAGELWFLREVKLTDEEKEILHEQV